MEEGQNKEESKVEQEVKPIIETPQVKATGTMTGFSAEPESAPKETTNPNLGQIPPKEEGKTDTIPPGDDNLFRALFGAEGMAGIGKPVEPEETTTEQVQSQQENIAEPPKVAEETTPQTPTQGATPPPRVYTEEEIADIVNQKVAVEVEKFQNVEKLLTEYQSDPYKFMAQFAPHLFKEFDKVKYVRDKLTEEFGADFQIDPQRSYIYGTTDYDYRMRQDQLVQEATGLERQALSQLQNNSSMQTEEMKQTVEQFKTAKAKALGIDVPTFETRIWKQLEQMDTQNVLDALVDAIVYKEKLMEQEKNLKSQVELSKNAPSPAVIPGSGKPPEKSDIDFLKEMFKDGFEII